MKDFLFLFPVIVFFVGCNQDKSGGPAGRNDKLQFDPAVYNENLREAVTARDFGGDSASYFDTLYTYYNKNNFNPILLKSFEEESFIISFFEILESADKHGLNPESYNISIIRNEFLAAVTGDSVFTGRYDHLAKAEIYAAEALLRYSWHLRYGVVNPSKLFPDSYFLPLPDSASRDLFEPLKQPEIVDYLYEIQPKSTRYTKLQEALDYYSKFTEIAFTEIPFPSGKIEPGDDSPLIPRIVERLKAFEYIDTSKIHLGNTIKYDTLLTESVKEFQRLNGLIDDGVIGKVTVEKLNIPPAQKIEKIKMALERFRWLNYSDSIKYILVNIPDFHLYAIEDGEEQFKIRVCTGIRRKANFRERMEIFKRTKKIYDKPDDWETPCLSSRISHFVLNPTWTVPQSIIREEIAGELRKDPTYLLRKNFMVYKNGIVINPADVKASEIFDPKNEYRIVQDPGPWNALGKIKFMFFNPFGIYLHDTPTRAPFNKSNRGVSHGCVRVEKPLQLAEFLLGDHSEWNIDFLKIEIGLPVEDKALREEYYSIRKVLRGTSVSHKPTDLKLENKIPVIIDYYTSWVDKDGKLNFRDDVYLKDKILAEHLFAEKISSNKLAAE